MSRARMFVVAAFVVAPFACATTETKPAQPPDTIAAAPSTTISASASAATAPSAMPSASVAATSPFHVAGAMMVSGLKTGNPLNLCAIEGGAFACGVSHVWRSVDGVFVNEPALEKGLMKEEDGTGLKGGVLQMLGTWPDDAWFVAGLGPYATIVLYRWTATTSEWKLIGKWKRPSLMGSITVVRLEKGRVVVYVVELDAAGKEKCRFETFGDGPTMKVPIDVADGKGLCRYKWAAVEPAANGIVLHGTRVSDDKSVHVLWSKGDKPKVVDGAWTPPAPPPSVTSKDEWRIVAGHVERKPKTETAWSMVTLPPPPPFASKEAKPFAPHTLSLRGDEVWIEAKFENTKPDGSPATQAAGAALLTTTLGKTSTQVD